MHTFHRLRQWLRHRASEGTIHWRWVWPSGKPYTRKRLRLYSDGGGIGDELMCTPVFRVIRRLNPECHLTFVSRHAEFFQANPNLNAVEPYSIDAVRDAIQLTYAPVPPAPPRPLITLMAECVGLALQTDRIDVPEVAPAPGVREKINALSRPLIVIQPQASQWTPNKQWPIEFWNELIRMLTAEFEVVEVGKETFFSEHEFGARFHSFAGATTMADFAWIVGRATAFVGPVSGGMHFANAFRIRSVIIFGGYESPEGYRYPLVQAFYSAVPCAQCWLTTPCPYDRKCLSAIRPEDVFRAVQAAALDPQWTQPELLVHCGCSWKDASPARTKYSCGTGGTDQSYMGRLPLSKISRSDR